MAIIDIGPDPIDRPHPGNSGLTIILKENPASEACTFTQCSLFVKQALSNLELGIFTEVYPNYFTTRSVVTIGSVPVGYQEIPISLAAEPGDFIGYYISSGALAVTTSGEGGWLQFGDQIPCTSKSFWSWPIRQKAFTLAYLHPLFALTASLLPTLAIPRHVTRSLLLLPLRKSAIYSYASPLTHHVSTHALI